MSNTYCRAAQEQLYITEKGKMQPCCYVEGPDGNNPDFVSSRLFNIKDPIDGDELIKKYGGPLNVYVIDPSHVKFRKRRDAVIFSLRNF